MKPPRFYRMHDYDLRLLPNPHLAELERGVRSIEEAKQKTGFTIGYPGWGFIYHLLLSHLDRDRQEVLIETGTNQGCTTIILAQALIDSGCSGRVLTFEIDENFADIARNNLRQAEVDHVVHLHVGDTKETLPPAVASLSDVRFAFLDAGHLYAEVTAEFDVLAPRLTDDAIVLFDNTYRIAEGGEDPRVNGALKDILARYGGNLINMEFVSWYTSGLAIWQKQPNL